MTWTKFGTEFGDEAAAAGLSDAAYRTHSEGIGWIYRMEATQKRITMRIPKRLLPRFAGSPDHDSAAKELCGLGWWKDAGDDWEVVHHAQVVRESIQAQRRSREGNRDRQRRHRQRASAGGPGSPGSAPDVTRDIPRDVTRDPEQNRPENHRGETGWGEPPSGAGRRTGGRRHSKLRPVDGGGAA